MIKSHKQFKNSRKTPIENEMMKQNIAMIDSIKQMLSYLSSFDKIINNVKCGSIEDMKRIWPFFQAYRRPLASKAQINAAKNATQLSISINISTNESIVKSNNSALKAV